MFENISWIAWIQMKKEESEPTLNILKTLVKQQKARQKPLSQSRTCFGNNRIENDGIMGTVSQTINKEDQLFMRFPERT